MLLISLGGSATLAVESKIIHLISMGECFSTWCALVNRGESMVYTCAILQINLYFTRPLYTFIHYGWILIFLRCSLKIFYMTFSCL